MEKNINFKNMNVYIGKGIKEISFISENKENPAKLGDSRNMNGRTIYKIIHPDICKTCKLTIGLTVLEKSSSWNTMTSHTHERRMEVYFYFYLGKDQRVFHMRGKHKKQDI